jgi:hypothetical protein
MPTVLRFDGLRVVIYPNDHQPAHVHVVGEGRVAVFYLRCPHGPPELRANHGFPRHRLAAIERHLAADLPALCSAWGTIHGHS